MSRLAISWTVLCMHIAAKLRKLLFSLHKSVSKKHRMRDALVTFIRYHWTAPVWWHLHRIAGTQGAWVCHTPYSAPAKTISERQMSSWETSICLFPPGMVPVWCRAEQPYMTQCAHRGEKSPNFFGGSPNFQLVTDSKIFDIALIPNWSELEISPEIT